MKLKFRLACSECVLVLADGEDAEGDREVPSGENRNDSRQRLRTRGVDPQDAGMGHRAPQQLGVHHAREVDVVGELRAAYWLATVVFVGGSFVRRGGQNILEPAACGKPVLFGPHMENFRDSVKVLLGRGGIQVSDFSRFERVLSDLLSDRREIEKLGRMARESVTAVQGASQADTDVILDLARGAS